MATLDDINRVTVRYAVPILMDNIFTKSPFFETAWWQQLGRGDSVNIDIRTTKRRRRNRRKR